VYDSIAAAETEKATAVRHRAIARALRAKLSADLDPVSADIAMVSYDLDRVAVLLAESVDYGRLTAILAADIDPARLNSVAEIAATSTTGEQPQQQARPSSKPTRTTAELVAALAARRPELTATQIASRLGIAERTASRHMPKAERAQADGRIGEPVALGVLMIG